MSKGSSGKGRGGSQGGGGGKHGATTAQEKAVLAKVGKALDALEQKADRLRKHGQRKDHDAFYARFLEEMVGLLKSATNLTNMTTAEQASLHERGRAFINGLRAGMVAMQGNLPPTTGGTHHMPQCIEFCLWNFEKCMERAEAAALQTARRRGVYIGYADLVRRQLACMAAFDLCVLSQCP